MSTISSTYSRIFKVLNLLRVWQNEEESKKVPKKKESEFRKKGWKFFYVLSFVTFEILVVIFAFMADKSEFSFLSEVSIGLIGILTKLLHLLWQKNDILAFVHDSVIVNFNVDGEEQLVFNKRMQNFMNFVQAYVVMQVSTAIYFIITALPIFTVKKKLPFYITFPLDGVVIYWIAYAVVAWGVALCIISNIITVIIWYVMLNYSNRYRILGNEFRNLQTIRTVNTSSKIINATSSRKRDLFLENFIELVKTHRHLYEYKLQACLI